LHTSLQVLMAYETSTVGWLSLSKTHGGYAAFKINASKKEGEAPENA